MLKHATQCAPARRKNALPLNRSILARGIHFRLHVPELIFKNVLRGLNKSS
jgi:hypothetical protein